MGPARTTKARGWWHAYGYVIPEGFDVYIGLEEAAPQLSWYEPELVPGILQAAAYAGPWSRPTTAESAMTRSAAAFMSGWLGSR